jgi:hypothetical protein
MDISASDSGLFVEFALQTTMMAAATVPKPDTVKSVVPDAVALSVPRTTASD